MDITQVNQSKFLNAAGLQGANRTATIESVAMEEVAPGESKPVVRFVGIPKGLVLNKTNTATIVNAYGKETEAWTGRDLMLFSQMVAFQGRMVPAIRVAPTAAQPAAPLQPAAASPPAAAPAPAAPQSTPAPAAAEPPNDPVPW